MKHSHFKLLSVYFNNVEDWAIESTYHTLRHKHKLIQVNEPDYFFFYFIRIGNPSKRIELSFYQFIILAFKIKRINNYIKWVNKKERELEILKDLQE